MTDTSPKVSVVIPCHNYGRFLPEALDSVLRQTLPAYEVLVVDDGSTDDTPEVVKPYGDAVRYLRVEGRGAYGARNDSLHRVTGDFFLNLDADNRLHPDFIAATTQAFQQLPETVGYVYTQRSYFGNRDGVSSFPAFDPDRLRYENYVDMGSLIRMDIVKRYRFDEWFNRGRGDHQFFLRLLQAGISGQLLDRPLVDYRDHDASITRGVRRRLDHVRIQQKILETVPDLYTPEQKTQALAGARNRLLVALIEQRDPDTPFHDRLRQTLAFARYGFRHAQFRTQLKYLFHPPALEAGE
jgi:glycosyltransferase involved in cell wall biosynthesis